MDTSLQCAPALHRRDGETCLPPASLERLRRVWNRTHPRHKINGSSNTVKKNGRKSGASRNLWKQLRVKMRSHYDCNTEYCAVKKLPLEQKSKTELLSYFRPEKPTEWDTKPTQWLDSYNIEDVMNQYEKAEANFEFVGPVPIDFDSKSGAWGKCIVDELCNLKPKLIL